MSCDPNGNFIEGVTARKITDRARILHPRLVRRTVEYCSTHHVVRLPRKTLVITLPRLVKSGPSGAVRNCSDAVPVRTLVVPGEQTEFPLETHRNRTEGPVSNLPLVVPQQTARVTVSVSHADGHQRPAVSGLDAPGGRCQASAAAAAADFPPITLQGASACKLTRTNSRSFLANTLCIAKAGCDQIVMRR